MKKIHKLRQWLTVVEAAKHLNTALAEEVGAADLLRLALDRHLVLSINLVNKARAKLGRVVPFKDVPFHELPSPLPGAAPDEILKVPAGILIDDVQEISEETRFVCFDKEVVSIDGVWDLTMYGGEHIDIEDAFQELTAGPAVELVYLEGRLISRSSGQWAQLQDRFEDREITLPDGKKKKVRGRYYPAGELPQDAHLVVRMDELLAFQDRLQAPSGPTITSAEVFGTRERETLLKLVIGMAVEAYRHDPSAGRSTAPGEIAEDLAKHGLSVTDDTIRKYLKEAAIKVLPQGSKG